jgi:hypothetical protein
MNTYQDYLEYKAESEICGYEVESYREWRRESGHAEATWQAHNERDELDLY